MATKLQIKKFAQPLGLRPAHGNFTLLLVVHAQLVAALEPGNHFLDAIDIDDKSTVRAPELLVI